MHLFNSLCLFIPDPIEQPQCNIDGWGKYSIGTVEIVPVVNCHRQHRGLSQMVPQCVRSTWSYLLLFENSHMGSEVRTGWELWWISEIFLLAHFSLNASAKNFPTPNFNEGQILHLYVGWGRKPKEKHLIRANMQEDSQRDLSVHCAQWSALLRASLRYLASFFHCLIWTWF